MQSESNPQVPDPTPPPANLAPAASPRLFMRRLGYAALTVAGLAIVAGGFYFFRPIEGNGNAADDPKVPQPGVAGWPNPDLAILISGQMHGYVQPCGCSDPQYGGLSRRYNFIESLRSKGWPVVAVDVGELAQKSGPQAMLKYVTSMKALKAMGYSAVGLGKQEFNMPLFEGLAHYSINDPLPTPLATNLVNTSKGQEYHDMNVRQFKVIDNVSPRLGIFSIVDARTQSLVTDPQIKFTPPATALAAALKEARANKAEITIMLYQGNENEVGKLITNVNNLRAADKTVPAIQIILCLSDDPEPPGRVKAVNGAQVVTVGHKGHYVGVIGLFRKNKDFQLKYELVAMGPKYETPKGGTNPVMVLMEEYAAKVHRDNYLARFPRGAHPLEVQLNGMKLDTKYVGSERCGDCHQHAYNVWKKFEVVNGKKKGHSVAFEALAKSERPSLRQFDGECIVCHTVGFAYNTGYAARNNPEKMNKKLENVGCESCHGPGGAHVNNPTNATIHALMNPLSTRRMSPDVAAKPALKAAFVAGQHRKQDDFCQKCHDSENDVHWGNVPYLQKWLKVDHMTPPAAGAKGDPKVEKTPGGIKVDIDPNPTK